MSCHLASTTFAISAVSSSKSIASPLARSALAASGVRPGSPATPRIVSALARVRVEANSAASRVADRGDALAHPHERRPRASRTRAGAELLDDPGELVDGVLERAAREPTSAAGDLEFRDVFRSPPRRWGGVRADGLRGVGLGGDHRGVVGRRQERRPARPRGRGCANAGRDRAAPRLHERAQARGTRGGIGARGVARLGDRRELVGGEGGGHRAATERGDGPRGSERRTERGARER